MARRKADDEQIETAEQAEPAPAPVRVEEPTPAHERLRAFEDEHFGKDAVRIDGQIERGSGSPYAEMSDEKRARYAALERLVVAEKNLADAHAALIAADEAYGKAEAEANG